MTVAGAATAPTPAPTRPGQLRPLVGMTAAILLSGVAAAFLWARLAPGQRLVTIDATSAATIPTESEHVFVGTAVFVLIGFVLGLLTAAAAWQWRRTRGPRTLVILVVASLLAALVARELGLLWVPSSDITDSADLGRTAPGTVVTLAPQLRTWVVLIGQPLGVAVAYAVAVATCSSDDLGVGDRANEPELSSAHTAPAGGPAEPAPPAAH